MAEEYNAGNVNPENITTTVMEGASEEKRYGAVKEKPDPSTLPVDEDGLTVYVTKDMVIGDIISWYPDAMLVLMKCGMHCVTCGVSQFETLDEACMVHGLYADDVAKVVNDYLTQTLNKPEE